jgi:DNA/RNA endonuclease G (NUC1)
MYPVYSRKASAGVVLCIACSLIALIPLYAANYTSRPNVLDPKYDHDKWGTKPEDHVFKFAAYTASFDGDDDNDGNGNADKWGIPEWVAYQIGKKTVDHPLTNRPAWFTDKELYEKGIAPSDETYAIPKKASDALKEVKGDYRFVRGHMCPKNVAERISRDAAFNTHTVLNACPQLQWQNNGVWKDLEELCEKWADKYTNVWVVCGPVFFGKKPSLWLGQEREMKIAVPDAFFKIVIKEKPGGVDTLAFLIPNIIPKAETNLDGFLVSVDRIESLTDLDFLTDLKDKDEAEVEAEEPESIDW